MWDGGQLRGMAVDRRRRLRRRGGERSSLSIKRKKNVPGSQTGNAREGGGAGARDAIRSVSRPRASTSPVSCPRRSSRQSINARFTYACVRVRVPSVGVRRPSSRGQARAHHAGAVEKLDGAYLLLSFSPGNSGYSFASGGAVGSDMVGFAVSFTGWGGAFTGSGAGFWTVEGSGGVVPVAWSLSRP